MGRVAFLWLLCTGVPNMRPQGCSCTLWWMAATGLEQWDATDVPWNGEHSRRREVGAWQVTVLFNHINEGLIWRARKLIIMKIKVGTCSPNMPSTIHERAHHRSSSKKAFRVQVGPMIRQSVLSRVVGGMNPQGNQDIAQQHPKPCAWTHRVWLFFCSTLLRCDLLAKKVPGRAPYSQHIIIRNWTYLNRSKTEHLKSFRPKTANKPINKLDRRRIWQKSVGSKSVQGEDRKERVANRELCRWQRSLRSSQPGRACSEEPVGEES